MLNVKQKKILNLLRNEPVKLAHWVGFKDMNGLHNDWIKKFLFTKTDQTLLAHRGSYKTTALSLFFAIHIVLYPMENVIFFRKTDTDVAEIINQTLKILYSGAVQEMVKTLYGVQLSITKATANEINTNLNTSSKGASQLVGLGITTSITGKHADIVVTDDIVNIKDRISRAERERTKTQYMELQNIVNRGGRFINTGTPWHKEDAISLMPNVRRFDCYSTGLITREKLENLRHSMSDSLFAANYELKHIADTNAMFKEPKFVSDETLIYGGLAHIDAAYDGEDSTAFTAFKRQPDGSLIGIGKLWRKHVDDCLPEIKTIHQRLRIGSIACEKNADKGYLAKELAAQGLLPFLYSETTNKFVKISTYLRREWDNIRWLEETDPDYINQILDYSEFAEHDDAPDSAASLIRRMEKEVRYNPVKGAL